MVDQAKYSDYQEVPFYRRQWFFWLMFFTLPPVGLGLLISGDIYFRRSDQVMAFGTANRVVAGIIGILWLYSLFSGLVAG